MASTCSSVHDRLAGAAEWQLRAEQGDRIPASRTRPIGIGSTRGREELQNDLRLSRPIETLLTDVVLRLRQSWISGPAKCWGGVYPISELAISEGEKRVSAALCEGFSQFSQFLCGLEVLLLQRANGSAEFEEALLGIEKLFVHGPNYFRRLGVVPHGDSSLADIDSTADGTHGGGDQAEIHKSSPNVEKGGVGTPDSTFGGNRIGRSKESA